ncbi:hypothetical protein OAA41_00565 [bacterium]|nr:hypothetical protein [bacterium]
MPLIELTSDLSRKDNPQDIQKILGRPSPTAIIRDVERITKFIISPKGLLFTGKQFLLQMMNPNTENVAGKAGIGLTKIYDPVSPITNTIGAPLGLRTDRHMPPIVRSTLSTYEGIHKARVSGGQQVSSNRLIRLNNELLPDPIQPIGEESGPRALLKKIQDISNTIRGFEGQTINTLSGLTGPQSLGGIGATTIRRYSDTSLSAQLKFKTTEPNNRGVLNQDPVEPKIDRIEKALFDGGDKREQSVINDYKQIMYGQIPDRANQPSIPSRIVRFDRLKENGSGNVKSYYDDETARQSNFENTLQLIETYDNAKLVNENGEITPNPENYSIIDFQFNDIKFKAYLGSLSDNFAPSWNNMEDQGRADARYQYGGFERNISFDFMVAIENRDDATVIWQKLQDLARLTHPVYGSQGFFGQTVDITIGKLFDARPMIIQDLGFDWDSENPWEIDPDRQHPMYTSVAMSCIVLGNRPQSNSKLYDIQGLE